MIRALAALLAITAGALAIPAEDGIYATFQTSRGSFVAKIDYDKVPATAANFIGLAEGTRPWVDMVTGTLQHRPFYDGITFHRVIPGFMIQSGSPNGQGTDGPGYTFGDEFHASLRHDAAGILSMANSGANSNGSQFFVTLEPTSWLDDKHSVFGHIVEGMDVVNAIGAVATPVTAPDVVTTIQHVTITRVGADAQAFDAVTPRGLPGGRESKAGLSREGSSLLLYHDRPAFSQSFIATSPNLNAWSYLGYVAQVATPSTDPLDLSSDAAGQTQRFYRVSQVLYPPQPHALIGKTVLLTLMSGSTPQVLRLDITGDPRGSVDYTTAPLGQAYIDQGYVGTVGAYVLSSNLTDLRFTVAIQNVGLFTFSLKFSAETEGWFTAQSYGATDGLWPYFGSFSIQAHP